MALTHDGKLLIAAALDKLLFFDVQKLIAGSGDPIAGSFRDGPQESSIYVNVSPDDKLLFASEERSQSITVIDLDRARRNGFNASAVLGTIPTGQKPIALTFSFDGKWLYTTSQVARPEWNWPKACKKEGEDAKSGQPKMVNPEGAVVVVDVERARSAPKESVAARIPAGCSPVRLALSPKGDRLYVTARNSNAVLAFDAAQLLSDGEHARLGMTPVGEAPVSLVVVEDGRRVVVGNSNRFGHSHSEQSLTVLDTAKMEAGGGSGAEVNEIPAGAFPREMIVSADGKALLWTNFGSDSLQVLSEAQLAKALSGQR
jgi:DNA-binding beta-propeller fold protein YncE